MIPTDPLYDISVKLRRAARNRLRVLLDEDEHQPGRLQHIELWLGDAIEEALDAGYRFANSPLVEVTPNAPEGGVETSIGSKVQGNTVLSEEDCRYAPDWNIETGDLEGLRKAELNWGVKTGQHDVWGRTQPCDRVWPAGVLGNTPCDRCGCSWNTHDPQRPIGSPLAFEQSIDESIQACGIDWVNQFGSDRCSNCGAKWKLHNKKAPKPESPK